MTAIPREALWNASPLRRFSPFRRFAASTLQRFNVSTPQRERASAFTLLELLIVVGIIGLLLVLMAPAFTTIKGGTDVTSSAYTIKDVLDTARTYAKANNTYVWVGFFEEDASQSFFRIVMWRHACPQCLQCPPITFRAQHSVCHHKIWPTANRIGRVGWCSIIATSPICDRC